MRPPRRSTLPAARREPQGNNTKKFLSYTCQMPAFRHGGTWHWQLSGHSLRFMILAESHCAVCNVWRQRAWKDGRNPAGVCAGGSDKGWKTSEWKNPYTRIKKMGRQFCKIERGNTFRVYQYARKSVDKKEEKRW